MNALMPVSNGVLRRLSPSSSLATTLVACSPSPPTEKVATDDSGKNVRDQGAAARQIGGVTRVQNALEIASS